MHLGHYYAVVQPGRDGVEVLVANYHAPREVNTEHLIETLRRFGVENIKQQRDVFDPELYFRLLTIAPVGALERMTQYAAADVDDRTAQLLTYPVLMAHDVAGYDEVYVGYDQMPHLHYAGTLLKRYNRLYGGELAMPQPKLVNRKVHDLRRPIYKMSKSTPDGCLFLDDSPDEIRAKIKRATMDEMGTENLRHLYTEFVGKEVPESNAKLKEELAQAFIALFQGGVP